MSENKVRPNDEKNSSGQQYSFEKYELFLDSFEEESIGHAKYSHNLQKLTLEIEDYQYRLKVRRFIAWFFTIFLTLQNIAVYTLVIIAFVKDNYQLSATALSVLVTGTLAETYLILRIMVTWVFGNIDYTLKK